MHIFNDQEKNRRQTLDKLIQDGNDPFAINKFIRNFNSATFKTKFNEFTKEQLHDDKTKISLAGRVMSIRQTFGVVSDFYGSIQFYINKKAVDKLCFEFFKKCIDIGDIVGICGTPMKTNTGELTINVFEIVLLSKSLKPLPEKWHGLQDEELRARKRYVDLIMNRDSLTTFVLRSKIVKEIRSYLDNLNFLEVETPILQPRLGGANARPFITKHNTLDRDYYLRIATELPLKKLIVGGFEKVYEIGRIFRNEGMDSTHNPEFTTIELYEAYSDMYDMMEITESIIKHISTKLGVNKILYKDVDIDLSKSFERATMLDLINKYAKIDFLKITTNGDAVKLAVEHNIELLEHQKT
jgi:lysyl-tRNA synthetase class 2